MPFQHTGRILKHNKASYGPQLIISVAVARNETKLDSKGILVRGSFKGCHTCYSRQRRDCNSSCNTVRHSDLKSFWDYVYSKTSRHRTLWLIGHNMLSELTLLGWCNELDSRRMLLGGKSVVSPDGSSEGDRVRQSSIVVLDCPPLIIKGRCSHTGGSITIVDIQNWHRETVVRIGTTVGVACPKLSSSAQSDTSWPDRTRIYAQVIHDAFLQIVRYVKETNLGIFRYTAAGQAMSAYRHKFYRTPIYVHDNMDIKKLERAAYFGGRTEVFRRGYLGQTVYQLDVNALFPYVMQIGRFPVKLIEYGNGGSRGQDLLSTVPCDMVAAVEVSTNCGVYPCRLRGTVLYPTGLFRTVMCGEELQAACNSGVVKQLFQWAVYDRSAIFSEYVTALYAEKTRLQTSGQAIWAGLVKLLLNSLYGKFAQLAPEWINCPNDHSMIPWTRRIAWDEQAREYTDYRSVGPLVQKRGKERESMSSFPAISAFVTAAARQYMNTLRALAGASHVYYQGCDSFITDTIGKGRLQEMGYLHPTEIGKLKVEMVADDAAIFGCQDYRIGPKTVIAGRKPDGSYLDRAKMRQLRESALASLFQGRAEDTILCENLPWTPKGTYYKGVVQPDGWVSPCELTGEVSSTSVSRSR